jgi:hypothetical protein
MYRLVTVIVAIFLGFTTHFIHAQQGCLSEGISFPNQSSIDNFPSNYPGCDTILGDLNVFFNGNNNNVDSLYSIKCIQGDLNFRFENVTNLSGLNNLTRIEGDLTFYQTAFENFSGLENLQIVGGRVDIRENNSLLNLEGLNGLDSILSATLYIRNNLSLVDLNGLNNLDYTSAFLMYNNQSLQSVDGLESLNQIADFIDIYDNPNLTSLEGLIGLDTIGFIYPYGSIRIKNNNSLVNLSGLDSINYMTKMYVLENDALESMQGFPKYAQQTDWIEISHNNSLLSLDGFEGVNYLNGLYLISNPALENINSLADVDSIGSEIVISNCNALDDISGLQSLTFLDGTIKLQDLPSLTSLEGLQNLEYAGGIGLYNLPELINLSYLNNLDSADSFTISKLDGLSSLYGLDSLRKVNFLMIGSIYSENLGNARLQNFNGVDNLAYIGELGIGDNDSLLNLDGLENVSTLNGWFRITHNDRLTDFNGLWNVTHEDISGVQIENNSLLSECSIDIVCQGVLSTSNVYISDNAVGCNSEAELLEDCSIFCKYYDLTITNQGQLNSFGDSYPDCQVIAGNLDISGVGVFDLSSLENIVEVRGYIKIHDCPNLNNLDGLDNIAAIYDYIQLENNEILTDISALNGIDPNSIDSLIIQGNTELSNCSIEAFCDYYLSSNSVMTIDSNNDGCNSILDFEEGCFGLSQNLLFTNQEEIDNFPSNCSTCNIINGNVLIEGSDITNLDSLLSIEQIIGYLNIGGTNGNPNLISISGLENLSFVGEELVINNNSSLTTLNGIAESENAMQLSDLESVGGNFEITNNNALLNLIGLEELTSVEGSMIISDNDELLSLTGIEDIDHSGITSITITNNPALSMCSVLSVCNYLDEASAMVDIFNNAEGCDSEAEVEINCIGVSITENELNKLIKIYPNPAHNELYITGLERKTLVNIYTQLGVLVLATQIEEGIIDISGLNQGIYIIELKHEEFRYRDKLIKK